MGTPVATIADRGERTLERGGVTFEQGMRHRVLLFRVFLVY